MRRTSLFIIFFFLFGLLDLALSQELKIAVYDLQRFMSQSKKVAELRKISLQDLEPRRLTLLDKEITVKRLEERLRTEGARLAEAERKALEERFQRELQDWRNLSISYQQAIFEKEVQLAREVVKKLEPIIKKVAEERRLRIIFEKNAAGLAYVDPSLDLTDTLVKLFDAKQ
ncbi:MAG: OmpH family outer membrane protein [Caldimicrobium sp.]|nr:OmpH family outer membrane protein [Caldimicrobium sp.]